MGRAGSQMLVQPPDTAQIFNAAGIPEARAFGPFQRGWPD